jgi:hypothetical protein
MAKEVRIIVRGIRRAEPDIERLARALVRCALAAVAGPAPEPQAEDQPEPEEQPEPEAVP